MPMFKALREDSPPIGVDSSAIKSAAETHKPSSPRKTRLQRRGSMKGVLEYALDAIFRNKHGKSQAKDNDDSSFPVESSKSSLVVRKDWNPFDDSDDESENSVQWNEGASYDNTPLLSPTRPMSFTSRRKKDALMDLSTRSDGQVEQKARKKGLMKQEGVLRHHSYSPTRPYSKPLRPRNSVKAIVSGSSYSQRVSHLDKGNSNRSLSIFLEKGQRNRSLFGGTNSRPDRSQKEKGYISSFLGSPRPDKKREPAYWQHKLLEDDFSEEEEKSVTSEVSALSRALQSIMTVDDEDKSVVSKASILSRSLNVLEKYYDDTL